MKEKMHTSNFHIPLVTHCCSVYTDSCHKSSTVRTVFAGGELAVWRRVVPNRSKVAE